MIIMFDDLEVTDVCLSWNLIIVQNITLVKCLPKWLHYKDLYHCTAILATDVHKYRKEQWCFLCLGENCKTFCFLVAFK